MRVPKKILAAAAALTDVPLTSRMAPKEPFTVCYTLTPTVPDVYVNGLSDDAVISLLVTTELQAEAVLYPVVVTHTCGWALVRWPNTAGLLDAQLWYAGRGKQFELPPRLADGPFVVMLSEVSALMKLTGLSNAEVRAALREVGPHAQTALWLARWLKEQHKGTYAAFRNDVLWLWYYFQFNQPKFWERVAGNPVIGPLSPNARVIMYGAKCVALAE